MKGPFSAGLLDKCDDMGATSSFTFLWLHVDSWGCSKVVERLNLSLPSANSYRSFSCQTLGPKLGQTNLSVIFQPKLVRKLRQINEKLAGYEPIGREFESFRARQ